MSTKIAAEADKTPSSVLAEPAALTPSSDAKPLAVDKDELRT